MLARTARYFCSAVPSGTRPAMPAAGAAAARAGFDGSVTRLNEMFKHNEQFVASGAYKQFAVSSSSASSARCVIVTCMDSRLTHLLPAALNIKQGDAKIIKTAGAILSHPFGGIMRSIIVALYELRASEVFVVGHDDCGMRMVDPAATKQKMLDAGVPEHRLQVLESAGVDVNKWLKGFVSLDESVLAASEVVRNHPLVPPGLRVSGLIINPTTGAVRLAASGNGHKHV